MILDKAMGRRLLKIARDSIARSFEQKEPDLSAYDDLFEKRGVFVSLHKDGELRGCIGFPEPAYPLNRAVAMAACAAAFSDPRFGPLQDDEFALLDIEVSVLTVPQKVIAQDPKDYPSLIKVGRDGLIVRAGDRSGLLLPQVAAEYGWSPEEFLCHTCQKAGLMPFLWKTDRMLELYRFEAQVFCEHDKLARAD